MALFDASAFDYAFSKETVNGVTNATTPAFLRLNVRESGTEINANSDELAFDFKRADRTSSGITNVNVHSGGSVSTILQRGDANDLLLSSLLGNDWATNKLTGSNKNISFTVEKKLSATSYVRQRGSMVNSMSLQVAYDGVAELTYDFLGMDRNSATAALSGATYGNLPTTTALAGINVTGVSLAGMTGLTYLDFSLNIEQDRDPIVGLGSPQATAVLTGGSRRITGSISFLREDFTPETATTGLSVLTLNLGAGVNGYGIKLPAVTCRLPQDETDGARAIVTVEFTADRDATSGTDIEITRLA